MPIVKTAFFSLVPIGIFFLINSIRLLGKAFNGQVLLEIPYPTKSARFAILKRGSYSIWQKGQLFRKTPVDQFKPAVFDDTTGEKILLYPSLGTSVNNGSTGRMALFDFTADVGNYRIELTEGSGISKVESVVSNLFTRVFPVKPVDASQYFIQIRESQPFYVTLVCVPLVILSSLCIVGGAIAGFLADQIFK